ncbi:DUF4250 domain-containing protein [Anaerocolumna sp. AGMB13020]|jgi:hypothetical protein|uniref:DUF4250 domain-containing protein n=1 Tax=Anaerocolumna sp. AGMB13020 TaxID=3081750 RepID=UPI0029529794|nr:DUF4250 domain-containing protein [Anaerocolumna sp. AGMB13020]WOO38440.1 DUF4250 domain-containing protein [Anaerocolumna sp. AGMB13020]
MTLPKDPFILLSYINTQLRDKYSSLADLCEYLEFNEQELRDRLNVIHYEYVPELNQFK